MPSSSSRRRWCLAALLLVSAGGMVENRQDRASERANLDCDRTITSTSNKTGIFTSPYYPEPYPQGVQCVYNFTGQPGERVQITFTDFDLHLPHEPPKDCESVDAVMIFIIINGWRMRLDNFCGNKLPKKLMSNDATMIVEFKSYHSSPEVKGFRGIYKFVTDFGIKEAKQQKGSECHFTFESEERNNGTFMSPNYPGYYPRDTVCNYVFKGKEKERVQITFTFFDVDGIPPCLQETASDYLEFSNYKTTDRKMPRYCGSQKPKYIESDSNYFRVVFKSNDKFDGIGFEAQYQFRKQQEDPFTVKRISSISPTNISSATMQFHADVTIIVILSALLNGSYLSKL